VKKPSETTDDPWVWAESSFPREHVTERSGKWMIFSQLDEHDQAWETIRDATESDELGFSAKAATAFKNPRRISNSELLICVYTYDYSDLDDVRRVFNRLRTLGFAQQLPYKSNADTRAGNYGNGVSLFLSRSGSSDFEIRRQPG
jgi:hypothetical protein